MTSRDRLQRAARATGAGLVIAACACQSILGIEELSAGPRDGVGGAGGATEDAGSGGANMALGGSMSGSGAGGSAEGGTGGLALSDAGPDAAGPSGPITVTGRVIDFFRRPVPAVPVNIGAAGVLTDGDGRFTLANVTPPYDVSLIANATSTFDARYYAYVYQGLTRPDPTLQVYYGLPQRNASLDLNVLNAALTDPNERLIFAFASADGQYTASGISDPDPLPLNLGWTGPATTAGNAHALLVQRSANSATAPPVAYQSYQNVPLALSDDADSNVSFDMSVEAIPQVTLTGSVDRGAFSSQTHLISSRMLDGTVLPLLSEESTLAAFTYLVPSLPGASMIVAASASSPGFVVAHADGVAAAQNQNVELALPRPVTPGAPGTGTAVSPGTLFSWSTLGQTAGVFVWHLESQGYFEGIYVITSRSEIEYPVIPGYSMVLPTSQNDFEFYWSVETHGDYPSVDAAAGPQGFFDPFALESNVAAGPARGNRGYYTNSDIRFVDVTSQ